MIILSHSGKQHSYQVAAAMYELGVLERFYTSSYVTSAWIQQYLGSGSNNLLSRRFIPGLPSGMVDANWRFELPEIILRKLSGKSRRVQEAVYRRDVKFDSYMAEKLKNRIYNSSGSKQFFWGFQGSCHASLASAEYAGLETVAELSTAHVTAAKKILGEEAKLHPEWAGSIDNLVFPKEYELRLTEEPLLAQHVVAASSFTMATLLEAGVPGDRISLLPLGADTGHIHYRERVDDRISRRPLRLLYAGTITQRKGIVYLLEAVRKLGKESGVELHIIGGIQGDDGPLKSYSDCFTLHGAVSQEELFIKYGEFDALVLPTVFEGFGLVIVEAMAAGLPVITTEHSIGPEVIIDGENGFIIPIRDVDALVNAISALREKDDDTFAMMRKQARESATGYSWERYRMRLWEILKGWEATK